MRALTALTLPSPTPPPPPSLPPTTIQLPTSSTHDPKKPRTLSEFTYPLRPTPARFIHVNKTSEKSSKPTVPKDAAANIGSFVDDVAQATATGNPGRLASAVATFTSGVTSLFQEAPEEETMTDLPAAGLGVPPAAVNTNVVLEPSDRFMELQYFLTYLYAELGASYCPAQDASWITSEILVNDQYYG
jgi:hypothetical protein